MAARGSNDLDINSSKSINNSIRQRIRDIFYIGGNNMTHDYITPKERIGGLTYTEALTLITSLGGLAIVAAAMWCF